MKENGKLYVNMKVEINIFQNNDARAFFRVSGKNGNPPPLRYTIPGLRANTTIIIYTFL